MHFLSTNQVIILIVQVKCAYRMHSPCLKVVKCQNNVQPLVLGPIVDTQTLIGSFFFDRLSTSHKINLCDVATAYLYYK